MVIVKDNAGFLSARLCSFHNLFLDVSSKLAAFDLMTQKDHLVWFDHTILDDRLFGGQIEPGYPEHLLAPYFCFGF